MVMESALLRGPRVHGKSMFTKVDQRAAILKHRVPAFGVDRNTGRRAGSSRKRFDQRRGPFFRWHAAWMEEENDPNRNPGPTRLRGGE